MRGIWQIASVLGTAASVLSIVLLVKQGFDLGIAAPLKALLSSYENALSFLLGWADQPLQSALNYLNQAFRLKLNLHDHWKHFFVLMWLYFSMDARANLIQGNTVNVWCSALLGLLVATVGSIGAGTASIDEPTIAAPALLFPFIGFMIYIAVGIFIRSTFHPPLNQPWKTTVSYYFKSEFLSLICVAVLSTAVAMNASTVGLPNPNLVAFCTFILLFALYWLLRGLWLAITDRQEDESLVHRFRRSGSGRFAILFFTVIAGVVLFFALNAGLDWF